MKTDELKDTNEFHASIEKDRYNLKNLTGFRIIAAFLVLFSHYGTPNAFGQNIAFIAAKGYSGVTAFFMLSGLVLTWSQLTRNQKKVKSYKNFMIDRFSKIYPLHLLIMVLVIIWFGFYHANIVEFFSHIFLVQAWLPNLKSVFKFNAVSWSLSVEVFLYLCFPFVFPVCMKIYLKLKSFGILLILGFGTSIPFVAFIIMTSGVKVQGGSQHYVLYRLPPTRLGDFIVGIGLAFAIYHFRKIPTFVLIGLQITTVFSYAIVGKGYWLFSTRRGVLLYDLAWLPIFAVLLFALGAEAKKPYRHFLSSKLFVNLGIWSFALYLIHFQFWKAVTDKGMHPFTSTNKVFVIFLIILISTVIFLSMLLHKYFEMPVQTFLRKILKKPKAIKIEK